MREVTRQKLLGQVVLLGVERNCKLWALTRLVSSSTGEGKPLTHEEGDVILNVLNRLDQAYEKLKQLEIVLREGKDITELEL